MAAAGRARWHSRATLEADLSGIVITNDDGRIVLVNRQTERLFGCSREELIGQPAESWCRSGFMELMAASAP